MTSKLLAANDLTFYSSEKTFAAQIMVAPYLKKNVLEEEGVSK